MIHVEAGEARNRVQAENQALVGDIVACSELSDEPNDVLGANMAFRQLPHLFSARDYKSLILNTEALAVRAQCLTSETSSPRDLSIAQRDLAEFVTLSTIMTPTRREVPVAEEAVPHGARELVRLSRILDVPPRMEDSNWANPKNSRFFSDTPLTIEGLSVRAEAIIKTSVGRNWERVDEKIEHIVDLTKIDFKDPAFAEAAAKIVEDYQPMIAGATISSLYITRNPGGMEFFMNEFLRATKLIEIGGENVVHSGAALVGPHLIDSLMGITTSDNYSDVTYREQNLHSAPMVHQAKFQQVLTYVERNGNFIDQLVKNPDTKESAEGVFGILKAVSAFRGAHKSAVSDTEPKREHGESSGQRKEMVYDLLGRTNERRDLVKEIVRQAA